MLLLVIMTCSGLECSVQCKFDLENTLNQTEACKRFEHAPPEAIPFADCIKGWEVGATIGCLHRCSAPKSQWRIHEDSITKARHAGCKPSGGVMESRACAYGFHLSALKIFESGFKTKAEEGVVVDEYDGAESYIVYPVELPDSIMVYVYMEEDSTPDATAIQFCSQQRLTEELEQECVRNVKTGLQERLENHQWESEYPRVMMFYPVELDGEAMRLVAYHGESPQTTAQLFCAQAVEKDNVEMIDACFQGLLPNITPHMARLKF